MKLSKLLENINHELKNVEGLKYEKYEELTDAIDTELSKVKTELGILLRINHNEVRLITRDEINISGSVGEDLFTPLMNLNKDKRVKYGWKGTVIEIEFIPSKNITEEILDVELIELKQHFDNLNNANSKLWYDREIESLENKIKELKIERDKLTKE